MRDGNSWDAGNTFLHGHEVTQKGWHYIKILWAVCAKSSVCLIKVINIT